MMSVVLSARYLDLVTKKKGTQWKDLTGKKVPNLTGAIQLIWQPPCILIILPKQSMRVLSDHLYSAMPGFIAKLMELTKTPMIAASCVHTTQQRYMCTPVGTQPAIRGNAVLRVPHSLCFYCILPTSRLEIQIARRRVYRQRRLEIQTARRVDRQQRRLEIQTARRVYRRQGRLEIQTARRVRLKIQTARQVYHSIGMFSN